MSGPIVVLYFSRIGHRKTMKNIPDSLFVQETEGELIESPLNNLGMTFQAHAFIMLKNDQADTVLLE